MEGGNSENHDERSEAWFARGAEANQQGASENAGRFAADMVRAP